MHGEAKAFTHGDSPRLAVLVHSRGKHSRWAAHYLVVDAWVETCIAKVLAVQRDEHLFNRKGRRWGGREQTHEWQKRGRKGGEREMHCGGGLSL